MFFDKIFVGDDWQEYRAYLSVTWEPYHYAEDLAEKEWMGLTQVKDAKPMGVASLNSRQEREKRRRDEERRMIEQKRKELEEEERRRKMIQEEEDDDDYDDDDDDDDDDDVEVDVEENVKQTPSKSSSNKKPSHSDEL